MTDDRDYGELYIDGDRIVLDLTPNDPHGLMMRLTVDEAVALVKELANAIVRVETDHRQRTAEQAAAS